MPSLTERISRAEEQFIQAAGEGDSSLAEFRELWSTLLSDVEKAFQAGHIDPETVVLLDSVASRVAILNDYLIDFQAIVPTIPTTLHGEIDEILARVDINAIQPTPEPTCPATRHGSPSQPSTDRLSHPSYVALAYDWLLNNLHNPYPSKETRNQIALKTTCDRKFIDAWFIDARKRIGWNSLRREKFSNKRIDIVDAAMRFFGKNDVQQQSLDDDFRFEFLAIEMQARQLYAGRFSESVLVTNLDKAIKDMTSEVKAQMGVDGISYKHTEKEAMDQAFRDALAASSYPSPHRSPSCTPSPLPSHSIILPVSITGRKRSSPVNDIELSHERSNKRSRLEKSPRVNRSDYDSTGLPSPALSSNEPLPTTEKGSPTDISDLSRTVVPTSRKRRMSDADQQTAPKRPRHALSGPRLHAVSDPLPTSAALSVWFENNFGIPDLAAADQNDSSPVDIELFDYSNITAGSNPSSDPTVSNLINPPQDTYTSTSLEAIHPASEVPFSLNISTNDFNYNELFYDPEDATSEPSQNFEFNPSLFELVPRAESATLGAVADTAVITDTSVTQNVETSFDWIFPPLLPSEGNYDLAPDFRWNSPSTHKAAKQRKVLEMKEELRRLEAEIAASS